MKKLVYITLIMAAMTAMCGTETACTDKKPVQDSIITDSLGIDTMATDTLDNIIAEEPLPKAADELFDDFIFNFAANKRLQLKRIKFPLPEYTGNMVKEIAKSQWRTEHFFMQQDFYTLIFDNKRQMNIVKDTSVGNAIVEKIYLSKKLVKQYVFKRENGSWMMVAIRNISTTQSKNASFLSFYHKFVSDDKFQIQSISNPLSFTGPDPDDDFSTTSGFISPEQWPSFAPELPNDFIYNILYGQKYTESKQKIFVIKGIANGLETDLTFKRVGNKWMLTNLSI